MQISRNHRTNQTFLQIKSGLFLSAILIVLLAMGGCVQPKHTAVNSAQRMLPMVNNPHLPEVIIALINQSDEQYFKHDLNAALATLERAVRIDPRLPEVWSRMAQVYLDQGKLEQARQHAKRSNSVLKNNMALKDFNDNIISGKPMESSN